jgi:hypothetical protein
MTAMLPQRSSDDPVRESSPFEPVARLGSLSAGLAALPLGPRPDFRSELRGRLLAEAARATPRVPSEPMTSSDRAPGPVVARRRSRLGRRATAVGLAVALAGGGIAAAAAGHSLPGQPLYPAKRLGQAVQLALDPSSGPGPSLRLVSDRISDAERTLAADPAGADAQRWRAVDAALDEADRTLVGLSGAQPATELRPALTEARTRLERLLAAVPATHRAAVQRLLDTLDGLLPAAPVAGDAGALSALLLPGGHVSPSDALAAGWPIDLSALAPPPATARAPGLPDVGSVGGLAATGHPAAAAQRARSTRTYPPAPRRDSTPTITLLPSSSASRSDGTTAAPRTGLGRLVDPTPRSTSSAGRTRARTGVGRVVSQTLDDVSGDATDLLAGSERNGRTTTR